MLNQSRRKLLKGIAYGSALSVSGLTAVALTASPQVMRNKETITLFNQSDKTVTLNASQPVSVETVNGWVVVKINKHSEQSTEKTINLVAGQQRSFTIDADIAPLLNTTGDYIVITNEFTALNNMVPITTVDVMAA